MSNVWAPDIFTWMPMIATFIPAAKYLFSRIIDMTWFAFNPEKCMATFHEPHVPPGFHFGNTARDSLSQRILKDETRSIFIVRMVCWQIRVLSFSNSGRDQHICLGGILCWSATSPNEPGMKILTVPHMHVTVCDFINVCLIILTQDSTNST